MATTIARRSPRARRLPHRAWFGSIAAAAVSVAVVALATGGPVDARNDHAKPRPTATPTGTPTSTPASTPTASPTATPSYLEGVDISNWQGTVDFVKVRGSGRRFVVAKATEGIGWKDPSYATYKTNAMAAGLAFTAYHFARPDGNSTLAGATGEADWFVDSMGLQHGMLVPALDLEVHGTLTTTQLTDWVRTWLDRVYVRTGARAMIYTSPSFWKTYLADTRWFADNGYAVLWVAHWGVSAPTVPASNWGGRSWTFWQYSDCGAVPGIAGCVDVDRYRGLDLSTVTY